MYQCQLGGRLFYGSLARVPTTVEVASEDSPKPWWERVASAIAAIMIPVVVAVVGNNYTKAITEREVQGQFVELAVNILSEDPSEQSQELRMWAVSVINRYSGVPLPSKAREHLIKNKPLPPLASPQRQLPR